MAFGIVPTGFDRKSFQDIVDAINTKAVARISPSFNTAAESPNGQLIGIFAGALAELWEVAEAQYQATDPRQSEASALDAIGVVAGIGAQAVGESDEAYRARIINRQGSTLQTLQAALSAVPGVTLVDVVSNTTENETASGIPAGATTVIVEGGTDVDVANAIYGSLQIGITLFGNTTSNITSNGICLPINFTRPSDLDVLVSITVRLYDDGCGCNNTNSDAIRDQIISGMAASCSGVGRPIFTGAIASTVGGMGGVEVVSVQISQLGNQPINANLIIPYFSRAVFSSGNITVNYVK